ncbi:MAG TPA: DNA starvation/stationary phase protection protein Dps [Aliidongia sp.]|uniref:DNA starvation/stationary phase protection protein Dps n=1 Tax=Aliidongia sp. TaxID=1914230 RepID=UPI002DDCACF1|nr:DNA starvation/stationary phase protection protein Dps [Aliidongia sp.]HEV2675583.1 DNA starvation/stationary phase protection protein Dps [Aliidongia sp.]
MHRTKIDLADNVRAAIIGELGSALADSVDLSAQVKQAHWNVKGPSFIALHELFDQVAADVRNFTDEIAERIVILGGTAHGTVQEAAGKTRLAVYPSDISAGANHVEALSSVLAAYGKNIRASIDTTAELGDAITADILTGVGRSTDKWLWMVEAHRQSDS